MATKLTNNGTRRFAIGPLSRHVYDKKTGTYVPRENHDDTILKFDTPADDVIPAGTPRQGRTHPLSPEMAKHLKASPCFKEIQGDYKLEMTG